MAVKAKKGKEEVIEAKDTVVVTSLRDYRIPMVDETGATHEVDYVTEAALVVEAARSLVALAKAVTLQPSDCVAAHAFLSGLEKIGKDGKEVIRPAAIEAAKAAGGTAELPNGKITFSVSVGDPTIEYTEQTVELLESKGLFERSVNIVAELKKGVEADHIPDEDRDILLKYFDMEYEISKERVDAQIVLGNLSASEVEATVKRTPGKPSERLTITPNKELKKRFEE